MEGKSESRETTDPMAVGCRDDGLDFSGLMENVMSLDSACVPEVSRIC